MKGKYALEDYIFQFITVTAGVLIALLINGLDAWNDTRELVLKSRTTIEREIADNKKELDSTVSGFAADHQKLQGAIKFADQILTAGRSDLRSFNLNYNMAELSNTSWRTADRTGALSQMEHAEVQKFSKLYDFQDVYLERQRDALRLFSTAMSIVQGDEFNPDKPNLKDVELFRQRVMELRATLIIQQEFAGRLSKAYDEALQP
jgi:hypothetical protein